MISFDGQLNACGTSNPVYGNIIEDCIIDGGGANLGAKIVSDCISSIFCSGNPTTTGANADYSRANIVRRTDISYCPDKAVKVSTGAYARVENSSIRNNIGGGLQVTQGGNLSAAQNVIDRSGFTTSLVFNAANGIAANGQMLPTLLPTHLRTPGTTPTPSRLETNGNVIRNSAERGITVNEWSIVNVNNDFSCGANGGAGNGFAMIKELEIPGTAKVRGSNFVYNARHGATINDNGVANFGKSELDQGNNAFAANRTNPSLGGRDFHTVANPTPAAVGNQWTGCPGGSCTPDIQGSASYSPVQFYKDNPISLTVFNVSPRRPRVGELVHISGTGFNAVEAFPTPTAVAGATPTPGGSCSTTKDYNDCTGAIAGMCVQIYVAPGIYARPKVRSITPTDIAFEMPVYPCSQPTDIIVTRENSFGNPSIATLEGIFCSNAPTPTPSVTPTP